MIIRFTSQKCEVPQKLIKTSDFVDGIIFISFEILLICDLYI